MKKIIIFLVIFFQLICFSVVSAETADLKTVKVGIYDNPPKIYKDEAGKIKGFWADITDYIAQKEGWNLIYVYGTWDEGLSRLENGEIDIMVDVAVTDERKQKYDFNNQTALLSWSIFYTRKGFELKSFNDLEDKKIAVMKSSVHYTAPLGLKNILSSFGVTSKIIDVKSMEDVFKLLDTDQADAGVVNWNFGLANESNYKITRTGLIFNLSQLSYALTKNNPKNSYFISILDRYLKELHDDTNSVYYKSIQKNFGKALGTVEVQVLPSWFSTFLWIALILLSVIVCILILMRQYQRTLKGKIEEKIFDIKESEEKYRSIFEESFDGLFISTLDGKLIDANKRGIEIFGYNNREDMLTVDIEKDLYVNPEERKKILEIVEKKGYAEQEVLFKKKNGEHFYGYCFWIKIKGKKGYYRVIVRDISERKKMESEASSMNAILMTNLDVSPDGVLVVDDNKKIVLYNQRFIDMWKVPNELIEKKDDNIVLKYASDLMDDPVEFLNTINFLYENKNSIDRREIKLKDGRFFDRYSVPMIGKENIYYGRLWLFRDITERKQEEEKIVGLEKTKTEFISIAAHQMKAPITAIMGSSAIMLSGTPGVINEDQKEFLDIINKASKNMNEMVGFLLRLSKVEMGKMKFSLKAVDIKKLTEDIIESFRLDIESKSIRSEIVIEPDPFPHIFMDEEALRQVFGNLISNAINYSPAGSKILITIKLSDGIVEYSVKDWGIGVAKDEQSKIFDKFYRASNAIENVKIGTGLGLPLVKALTEAWGGKVWFESEENRGTTFHVTIPMIGKGETSAHII